jgi:hypothetical protein
MFFSGSVYARGGAMFGLSTCVSFLYTAAARWHDAAAAAPAREMADARAIAPALAARSVRLYGAEADIWTRRVHADFGRGFDDAIEYVRCDTAAGESACERAGVTLLPSWDFNDGGGLVPGYLPPDALARRLEEYRGDP